MPEKKDEEIVITGISGRFPECENVEEFKENLFAGVDMVTANDRRWPAGYYGLPHRTGTIKHLEFFDATFFGVHPKQADVMDPQLRLMLELTHEALIDAGLNPVELRGSRIGVFVGVSISESLDFWSLDQDNTSGYGLTGGSLSMLANRISFCFDFNGPSYPVDTACASGLYALDQAVTAIKTGQCESAVVAGVNLLLKPTRSLQFHLLSMLNQEGKCKSFDESGNGYVRSEAAVITYLQKASEAKRIYAYVAGSKVNTDGYKHQGITFPAGHMQYKLIREVYEESGLNPKDLAYMEAHGTGTRAGDPQELNSITDAFCKNRKTPLLIGSVKSNIGHAEAASGLCAIVKTIIAMETGVIPTNLHYKSPNPDAPGLIDGRLKVVTQNQPWNGGYVGINSLGFGGTNSHVILKSYNKRKSMHSVENLPRLITVSGRTSQAVNTFLDKLERHANDPELMALIYEVHKRNITGHGYRGYSLLGEKPAREVSEVPSERRAVWFVYSGMGSQWGGMAKDMMKIDVFRKSIQKSSLALLPRGINLEEIITTADESAFDNVLNSFVAITSIQIALTDVLYSLGVRTDGIIGHSVGEIGCAYADGTLTAEQAILTSYSRGKAILESNLPLGAMAAVGLTWEECIKRCPPGVYPACHNSTDNVSVSGPPDLIKKFVDDLTVENIFARNINSSGQAFHSKYMEPVGPKLKKSLEAIIKDPKERSSKWVSSSLSEIEWHSPLAKSSSPDYHVNNLLSPVRFYEATRQIPEDAVLFEIAPHCLLQSVLKRAIGPNCTPIGLMKRGHEDNLQFFMSSLGKIYNSGSQPKLAGLYKPVSFPVSRGTPMIQSMIEWDHSIEWTVPYYPGKGAQAGQTVVTVNLSNEEDSFIAGHNINGRVLFPATGYLGLIWKTYAKLRNEDYEKLPVIFEDIFIQHATIMPKNGPVKFSINILEGSGDFVLSEGGSVVITGRITTPQDINQEMVDLPTPKTQEEKDVMNLKSTDIYTELQLRGYNYNGLFKGIYESDNRGQSGWLKWEKNWVTFTDAMLQFSVIGLNLKDLYVPTRIQKVVINPELHQKYLYSFQGYNGPITFPVHMYRELGIVKSGGVEIHNMKANLAPRRVRQPEPKHERYLFVPFENNDLLAEDFEDARVQSLIVLTQTVIENSSTLLKLKIAEIAEDKPSDELLAPDVVKAIEFEPEYTTDYTIITTESTQPYLSSFESLNVKIIQSDLSKPVADKNLHLVICHDIISKKRFDILENGLNSLRPGGMILLSEFSRSVNLAEVEKLGLEIVSKHVVGSKTYLLLRQPVEIPSDSIVIQITENNFKWVQPLAEAMKKAETDNTRIYLFVQNEEQTGILGLTTCLMREPGGMNVRMVFIQDKKSERFSLTNPFFVKQLKKDLMFNVLRNGCWGTYRHILLDYSIDTEPKKFEHAFVNTEIRGDLSSLKWFESPLKNYKNNNPNMELCSIYYSALNFRDVMLAIGKLPPDALPGKLAHLDCILGLEFSGRDSQGRRVMGMAASRCLATTALGDKGFMWEIPENWSMEEAATIPIAYATAYYALVYRGRMRPGESVLIHAGSGAVGQASITIALHLGCTVFTTVGTQAKREFIKKQFPQIKDDHIGNSRDTSFEHLILQQTNGRGVDLVLNSLAEEKLQASIRCLANHGRFLEIGKVDLNNNNPLGMGVFLKNASFHGILLDSLIEADYYDKKEIWKLVSEGIKSGVVKPLPTKIFSENQVDQAFRYIAQAKHIGKVLVRIRQEESKKTQKATPKLVSAFPRYYMNSDKSYILVGGLGAMGLQLTNWLVNREATKIILVSRNGITTGFQSLCVRRWKELGATIVISTADSTTEAGAKQLLEQAKKLGPVGGIFNLATVLHDAMMIDQTEEKFKLAYKPKFDSTKNLDKLSRVMCPELDIFMVWSSLSCGRGNEGQSNYGYANSAMERLCEARKAAGFPTLVYQTSAIGDVGLSIALIGSNENTIRGTHPQVISACLQTIEKFLLNQKPYPILCTMVVAEKHRANADDANVSLAEAIANILGIKDVKTAPLTTTLSDLGMDSLMGDEVKQTLERNYDIILTPHEIRALTFNKINELSAGSS